MNINKIKVKKYKAFENVINIDLCNKIINFVLETTTKKAIDVIDEIQNRVIWFQKTTTNTIQDEYGFKYFGEILERYEQRIGNDIKDIRAIALALAYSKELVTENMIVGSQLINFINKIKRLSENDMYLKSALYLYDNKKYEYLYNDLFNKNFKNTEDIVFVISIFENTKMIFDLLSNQLKDLLGKNKTITVMDNVGIYNWLIKTLYPLIKGNRKKDIGLFKALISIPTCFVKEDSKIYKELVDNKYMPDEISFLNYILIYYKSIPNSVRIGKSIVEEKIAINLCKKILNNKKDYQDCVYDLIETMLYEYTCFDIKCNGNESIKQAIINNINIKNPKAFIRFYDKFDREIYSFNILDDKWKIIHKEFSTEEYLNLFDKYLLHGNFNKMQIEERIQKFNEITKYNYIDSFDIYKYNRQSIFSKLIDNNVIDIIDYFEKYRKQTMKKMDLRHLKYYIEKISNRKSFLFLKYFLNLGEYDIVDTKKYGFELNSLFSTNSYYYSYREIDIKRDFLSDKEHVEFLNYLESYIFKTIPEEYISFVTAVLRNDFIETLISKESLRNLYFEVCKIDNKLKEDNLLRNKYLTKSELEEILKKEEELKEREKMIRINEKVKELKNQLYSNEVINFNTLFCFCDINESKEINFTICCKLTREYLDNNMKNSVINNSDEIIAFNKLMNLLLENSAIDVEEFKHYLFMYIRREKIYYAKNIRTYKINRKA